MTAGIEAVLGILRRQYDAAYREYRACLNERDGLSGQPAPAAMRERETEAAYKLAEARTLFEDALDSLAASASTAEDAAIDAHECDQDGEWVEVVDESADPSIAFDAPTCSICGDAQVVASRGDA